MCVCARARVLCVLLLLVVAAVVLVVIAVVVVVVATAAAATVLIQPKSNLVFDITYTYGPYNADKTLSYIFRTENSEM